MAKKGFEELLFEGALNAVRTLTLEELYAQLECLMDMGLPDDLSAFPKSILALAIAEKRIQRAMN